MYVLNCYLFHLDSSTVQSAHLTSVEMSFETKQSCLFQKNNPQTNEPFPLCVLCLPFAFSLASLDGTAPPQGINAQVLPQALLSKAPKLKKT